MYSLVHIGGRLQRNSTRIKSNAFSDENERLGVWSVVVVHLKKHWWLIGSLIKEIIKKFVKS